MSIEQINILLVEDNPGDARLIHEMLSGIVSFGASYKLSHAADLQSAAKKCCTEHFDVILLDMNLPDSNGISTIQHLNSVSPQTPIIILTGINDEQTAFQSVQYGVQSYILKNECTSQLLVRTIHYAIQRKCMEEQLRHLATHDSLTGLPNRTLFYDRLSQAVWHAGRNQTRISSKWKGAVILIDLDNFKVINDRWGHDQGDAVLQLVGQRLKTCLRESDTVARLGGDEFILIIEGIAGRADCLSVGQKLLKSLNQPITLEGHETSLNASIGISIFPDDAEDIDSLIRYADAAMYSAKRQQVQICLYQNGDK